MKSRASRIILLAAIAAAGPAWAQTFGGASASQKALEETGRVLKAARASADDESARQTVDRAADNGRLGKLAEEAQKKLAVNSADESRQLVDAVDRRLDPALKSAAPEGKVLIAQSAATPAMRAPDPDAPAPAGNAPARAPLGTRTGDGKKGKGGEAAPPSDIDIRSEGAVYLDSAQALAIFTDDVVVDHPQFHMTCDKLEVYFLKEEDQKAAAAKVPVAKPVAAAAPGRLADPDAPAAKAAAPAAAADSAAPQSGDAKLKQAIATGKKVVIRKLDEKGELQIGICRHATYVGESGDIILRQKPQVQRGNNVIIAREASTYMVLKQNGELKVHGPADTKIEQKPDADGRPKAPGAPAAPGAAPAGAPAVTPKKKAAKP